MQLMSSIELSNSRLHSVDYWHVHRQRSKFWDQAVRVTSTRNAIRVVAASISITIVSIALAALVEMKLEVEELEAAESIKLFRIVESAPPANSMPEMAKEASSSKPVGEPPIELDHKTQPEWRRQVLPLQGHSKALSGPLQEAIGQRVNAYASASYLRAPVSVALDRLRDRIISDILATERFRSSSTLCRIQSLHEPECLGSNKLLNQDVEGRLQAGLGTIEVPADKVYEIEITI